MARRWRWVALAATVLAIIGGGGAYWWAMRRGEAALATVSASIRIALGPGGQFSYDRATVHPLADAAVLRQVRIRFGNGTLLDATLVRVTAGSAPGALRSIEADELRATGTATAEAATARSLVAHDVLLPPVPAAGSTTGFDPNAMAIGDARLTDIAGQEQGAVFRIGSLAIAGWGTGRAGTAITRSITVALPTNPDADRVTLGAALISGFDLAATTAALRQGRGTPPPLSPVRFRFENFVVARGGTNIATVDHLEMTGTPVRAGGPSHGHLLVDRFAFQPATDEQRAEFKQLGLPAIVGSADGATDYTAAGGALAATERLTLNGLGTFRFGIGMRQLDLGAFNGSAPTKPAEAAAMLGRAELATAELSVLDNGVRDRVMRIEAARAGVTPEALAATVVAQLGANPLFGLLPNGEAMRTALARFMQNGGTISMTVRPPAPVAVVSLVTMAETNPLSLAAALGLQINNSPLASP